ncbi:hypothetical protein Tco_0777149 [Tanacetum coccineum]
MLGAAGVQIPENNLDDLHSSREEDGTSETMDPQDLLGLGVLFSRAVGFLRGTSVVVVILVKGHAFPTIVKVRPVGLQMYVLGSGFDLKVYSDSDYAGCNLDRKSTLGGFQILRGKLVCWSAKKQSFVAMSSAEAEYVAAIGCGAQVLWIKSQLADYDVLYDKVPIFCNNTSVIAISNNPGQNILTSGITSSETTF